MTQGTGKDRNVDSAWKLIRVYWSINGGLKEIFKSIYFWLAFTIWIFSFNSWLRSGWWDTVFQILPNLLGFTLGGYALTLTIGSDRFRAIIVDAKDNKGDSILDNLSATFVHFVVTQIVALLIALLAKSMSFNISDYSTVLNAVLATSIYVPIAKVVNIVCWGGGYLIFLYSVCLSGAACLCIFRLSLFLIKLQKTENEDDDTLSR